MTQKATLTSKAAIASLATLWALTSIACGSEKGVTCKQHSQCGDGNVCQNGQCVAASPEADGDTTESTQSAPEDTAGEISTGGSSTTSNTEKWPGYCSKKATVNGILKSASLKRYDANGRVIKKEIDDDGDGAIDKITTYFYDANGHLAKELDDSGADGTNVSQTIWIRDADGNILVSYDDFYGNKELPVYTHSSDANGRTITIDSRWPSGEVYFKASLSYNDKGQLVKKETDMGGDTTVDETVVIAYDAAGNVLERDVKNGEGKTVYRESTRYDAAGNRISLTLFYSPSKSTIKSILGHTTTMAGLKPLSVILTATVNQIQRAPSSTMPMVTK